jgi:hypothetical protein
MVNSFEDTKCIFDEYVHVGGRYFCYVETDRLLSIFYIT